MKTLKNTKYFLFLLCIALSIVPLQALAGGFTFYFNVIENPQGPDAFLNALNPSLIRMGREPLSRAEALDMVKKELAPGGQAEVLEAILREREYHPGTVAELRRPVAESVATYLKALASGGRAGRIPLDVARDFIHAKYELNPAQKFSLYLRPHRGAGGIITALAKLLNVSLFLWARTSEGVIFAGSVNSEAVGTNIDKGIHILFAGETSGEAGSYDMHAQGIHTLEVAAIGIRQDDGPFQMIGSLVEVKSLDGTVKHLQGGSPEEAAASAATSAPAGPSVDALASTSGLELESIPTATAAVAAASAAAVMSAEADDALEEGIAEAVKASSGARRKKKKKRGAATVLVEETTFAFSKNYHLHLQALSHSLLASGEIRQAEILTYFADMSLDQQVQYFSTGVLVGAPRSVVEFMESILTSAQPTRFLHVAGLMRSSRKSPWPLRWVHENGTNGFYVAIKDQKRRRYTPDVVAQAWQVIQIDRQLKIEIRVVPTGPVMNMWSIRAPDRLVLLIDDIELERRLLLGGLIDRPTYETFEKWYKFFASFAGGLSDMHINRALAGVKSPRFEAFISRARQQGDSLFTQLALMTTFREIQGDDYSAAANAMHRSKVHEGILLELALEDAREVEREQERARQILEFERTEGPARRKILRDEQDAWKEEPLAGALSRSAEIKAQLRTAAREQKSIAAASARAREAEKKQEEERISQAAREQRAQARAAAKEKEAEAKRLADEEKAAERARLAEEAQARAAAKKERLAQEKAARAQELADREAKAAAKKERLAQEKAAREQKKEADAARAAEEARVAEAARVATAEATRLAQESKAKELKAQQEADETARAAAELLFSTRRVQSEGTQTESLLTGENGGASPPPPEVLAGFQSGSHHGIDLSLEGLSLRANSPANIAVLAAVAARQSHGHAECGTVSSSPQQAHSPGRSSLRASAEPFVPQGTCSHGVGYGPIDFSAFTPYQIWERTRHYILSMYPEPYFHSDPLMSIANRNAWTDLLLRMVFLGTYTLPQEFYYFNGLNRDDVLRLSQGVPLAFRSNEDYQAFIKDFRQLVEGEALIQGTGVFLFSRNPTKPCVWAFHTAGSPASHFLLPRLSGLSEVGNGQGSDLDIVVLRPDFDYPEGIEHIHDAESARILESQFKEKFGEQDEYFGFKYNRAMKAWTHPLARDRTIPIKILFHKVAPPGGGWIIP